jgi:FkbM family methyltransferase
MQTFSKLKYFLSDIIKARKEETFLKYNKSYSQSGEDMIVNFIFEQLNIDQPSYIDIGAFHPYILSNTAFFYAKGCKGINIEPNPISFKNFTAIRKNDINLNIGVSNEEETLAYFNFEEPALNTFSESEAENLVKIGKKLNNSCLIQTKRLETILKQYCKDSYPDFLSIDVEGFDESILFQTINPDFFYPIVICTETISYSTVGRGIKDTKISSFLEQQGYMLYADTNINSIFVRKDYWIR